MKKNGQQKRSQRRTATSQRQERIVQEREPEAESRFEARERATQEMVNAGRREKKTERPARVLATIGSEEAGEDGRGKSQWLDKEVRRAVEKIRVAVRPQRMAQPRKTFIKIVMDVALDVQENVANLMHVVGLA